MVARLTNVNPHGVVFGVAFSFDVPPAGSGEGPYPEQSTTLSLAPSGQSGGEAVLVLLLPQVTRATVSAVEHFD